MALRFVFSGHESFCCKRLWLKKGYDAVSQGVNFSSPDAVVRLGVGKNMVSSIRYWLKSFGCMKDNGLTPVARFLFDDAGGADPYIEDNATLWLLHYRLVRESIASIYNLAFLEFRRERREFSRDHLLRFLERRCAGMSGGFNANSVKKDIGVFLQTYVPPSKAVSFEDYTALLVDLGLVRELDRDRYVFAETEAGDVPVEVVLYALCDSRREDRTLSLDMLQEIALIFGLSVPDLVRIVEQLAAAYPEAVAYSDNSGVKNVQFIGEVDPLAELSKYYSR